MNKTCANFLNIIQSGKYNYWRLGPFFQFDIIEICPEYFQYLMTYIFYYHGFSVKYKRVNKIKGLFILQRKNENIKLLYKYEHLRYCVISIVNEQIFEMNYDGDTFVIGGNYNIKYELLHKMISKSLLYPDKILKFIMLKSGTLQHQCVRCIKNNFKLYKKLELKNMNRDIKKMFRNFNIKN